jgi:phage baseplate assembly protein W
MADIAFYKDLGLDFTPHPVSGDVRPIVNEVAIKRSIMNLIKTKKGSRPFNPAYGCGIADYLFNYDPGFSEYNIKEELTRAITTFEPRVVVQGVEINFTDGGQGMDIRVQYLIRNINTLGTLEATITRTA